jgi:hypothetical protein
MSGTQPDKNPEETGRFSIVDSIADARQLEMREWRPQKQEWLVVSSIFLLYLMVALDATIVVPVLPVCCRRLPQNNSLLHLTLHKGYCKRFRRHSSSILLGGNIISPD